MRRWARDDSGIWHLRQGLARRRTEKLPAKLAMEGESNDLAGVITSMTKIPPTKAEAYIRKVQEKGCLPFITGVFHPNTLARATSDPTFRDIFEDAEGAPGREERVGAWWSLCGLARGPIGWERIEKGRAIGAHPPEREVPDGEITCLDCWRIMITEVGWMLNWNPGDERAWHCFDRGDAIALCGLRPDEGMDLLQTHIQFDPPEGKNLCPVCIGVFREEMTPPEPNTTTAPPPRYPPKRWEDPRVWLHYHTGIWHCIERGEDLSLCENVDMTGWIRAGELDQWRRRGELPREIDKRSATVVPEGERSCKVCSFRYAEAKARRIGSDTGVRPYTQ